MRIHVLGGEGFVGSAFVREARRWNSTVHGITRQNYDRFRGQACDLFVNANGNSKKFLADKDPTAEFEASVVSVQRSLLDFPCKRYVYLSSIDVYPCLDNPRRNREDAPIVPEKLSRYGLHKYLAEQLVRRYAARWLIIRLGGMVGEGLWKNPIFDILHGKPLRVHVESQYQYLNSEDVAAIVLGLADEQPANDVFNVCGSGCVTLREVVALVPGYRVPYAIDKPPKEHYEISVRKLLGWRKVPRTRSAVRDFVRQQLA